MKTTPGRTVSSAPPTSASCAPASALTAIYHNIIRNDLMRRVIHPAMYAAYDRPDPDFIDRSHISRRPRSPRLGNSFRVFARRIPLRPRHGAARISDQRPVAPRPQHIRSKRPPRTTPPTCRSTKPGWCSGRASSRSTGRRPNFSRRIGPHLSDGLGNDQDFSGVRPNRTSRPALSRPARRGDLPGCGRWMR